MSGTPRFACGLVALLTLTLMLVSGCGGGGGGGVGGGGGDRGSIPPQPTGDGGPIGDAGAAASLEEEFLAYLRGTQGPFVGAERLSRAIEDLHAQSPDVASAGLAIDRVHAAVVSSRSAFESLDAQSRLLGGWMAPEDRLDAIEKLAGALKARNAGPGNAATGQGLVIYYVNGIGVAQPGFQESKRHLQRFVRASLPDAQVVGKYNTSAIDAERSYFGAAVGAIPDPFFMPMAADATRAILREVGGRFIDLGEAGLQLVRLERFGRFGSDPIVGAGQARSIMLDLKWRVRAGQRVLLVPHSQGNFFVRDALKMLKASEPEALASIAVLMTGSPESIDTMREIMPDDDVVRLVRNFADPVAAIGDPKCRSGCVVQSAELLGRVVPDLRPIANHFLRSGYLMGPPGERVHAELLDLARILLDASGSEPDPEDLPGNFATYPSDVRCGLDGLPMAEIAWMTSAGATAYEVMIDGRSFGARHGADVRSTDLRAGVYPAGIHAGGSYSLVVRAWNAHGYTDSATRRLDIPLTTCARPGAFELQLAQPFCDGAAAAVRLAWAPSTAVVSYQVLRDGLPVGTSLAGSVLEYVDREVAPGRAYTYSVRAYNGQGTTETQSLAVYVPTDVCAIEEPDHADLVAQGVVAYPSRVQAGDLARVLVSYANHGEAAAKASVAHVRLSASRSSAGAQDLLLTSLQIGALAAGSTNQVEGTFRVPDLPAGTWYLWVILDVGDSAGQVDRSNDTAHATFEIEDPDVELVAADLQLRLSDPEAAPGDPVVISVVLKDVNGVALVGKSITVRVGAQTLGSDTTQAGGLAQVQWIADRLGSLVVEAEFAGDDAYLGATDRASLTVAEQDVGPKATRAVLTASPSRLQLGQSLRLTTRVVNAGTGAGVANRALAFGEGGQSVAWLPGGRTNADGYLISDVTPTSAGTFVIEVIHRADSDYGASNDTVTIIVNPNPPKATRASLTADTARIQLGQSLRLTARVTNALTGAGVPSRALAFGEGGQSVAWLPGGRTNASGYHARDVTPTSTGLIVIEMIHGADSDYGASSATVMIIVDPVPPKATHASLSADPARIQLGQSLRLTARVTNAQTGAGVANRALAHGAGGQSVAWLPGGRTNASGYHSRDVTPTSTGTIVIELIHGGDADYGASSDTVTIIVDPVPPKATRASLTVDTARIQLGQSLRLTAHVTNAQTGAGVSNRALSYGRNNQSVAWLRDGETNASGYHARDVTPTSTGTMVIEVIHGGDADYGASSATVTIIVDPAPAKATEVSLSANKTQLEVGDSLTLTVRVKNKATGASLPNRSLSIGANAQSVGWLPGGSTGSNGIFTRSITPPAPGTYRISVDHRGDASYLSSSDTITITVAKRETLIVASVDRSSVQEDQTVTLRALLRGRSSGDNVAGGRVYLYVNNVEVGRDDTNSSGEASLSWRANRTGSLTVKATFKGDASYESDSDTASITVTPKPKVPTRFRWIHVSPSTGELGAYVTIEVKLEEDATWNYDINGRRVRILVNGGVIKSGYTDANGIVEARFRASRAGTQTVSAEFEGDTEYKSSSKQATYQVRDTQVPDVRQGGPVDGYVNYMPVLWWHAAEDPSGILRYEVEIEYEYLPYWWKSYRSTSTASNDFNYHTPSNIPADKYRWRVRAIDRVGNEGDWSGWWEFSAK